MIFLLIMLKNLFKLLDQDFKNRAKTNKLNLVIVCKH